MTPFPHASIRRAKSSASGASASLSNASPASKSVHGEVVRPAFPPSVVVAIKALACELPHQHGLPLSRLSVPEIRREAVQRGLVASIGETTVWRWLAEDAIRPWHHRSWLFPRDPDFEEKAARVLDLYAGLWRGRRLSTDDCILSADEKTSIQARRRVHPNDFQSLAELEDRLLGFQEHYEQVAKPFEWKFTRRDLRRLLSKLDGGEQEHRLAA